MPDLLIGCGNSRERKLRAGRDEWSGLVTLDFYPECKPDILHDLEEFPYPFGDSTFDEIHAYDVLEHQGRQGDWRFFFRQWSEFYRILKPSGHFMGVCPHYTSPWAWGDPSHTRIVGIEQLTFLSQAQYREQIGKTAMTDFRRVWQGDFEIVWQHVTDDKQQMFILKVIK